MIKKLGLIIFVMGLIIAFALPAFAFLGEDGKGNRFMLGGIYMTDVGYWNRSKEMTGTGSDQTQFFLAVPSNSRFNGFIEAGNAGAFWEFGMGYYATAVNGTGVGSNNVVSTRKIYGYYNFGNCYFEAGKNDNWLGGFNPQQRLGLMQDDHVNGYGWGANYEGRWAQVRFTQQVSKEFGYAISLVSPTTAVDSTRTSYASFPIIAAKVMLNFGVVSLQPAAYFTQMKWDNMPSGYDDNFTSWLGILPVKVVAGPFTGLFQIGYGQNISNVLGTPTNPLQVYQRTATGAVKNTTALNGFFDLAYTIGPVTPHVYVGYDQASNSDGWTVGENSNTRMMYGISVMYLVTKNFGISPEFTYYDWGKRPNTAGSPDIGKEWLAGVQFVWTF